MVNRASFFNRLKTYGLFSKLNTGNVQGMAAIIDEYERLGWFDLRWLAYIMATVYHETIRTMQPIEELGRGKGKPYGSKLKYGGGPGKRVAYTCPDKIYFGRGHTQNTWFEIYEKLSNTKRAKDENWDFLNNPELLLQMKPSIWATFFAMSTGLYTGRKLSQYFDGAKEYPVKARAIINGSDKAELISGYYVKFLKCLV